MNVLIIGSGGREHALCWRINESPHLTKLYCAPGNAGIAELAECVPLKVSDHAEIIRFCQEKSVDVVVIGPEAPLVAGLADDLRAAGIACFGPGQRAARLEGSKSFAKDLCRKYHIPTAAYETFTDAESAKTYLHKKGAPIVIKADGLAAGKGVTVAHTLDEAIQAVEECFSGKFGEAGNSLVIEEFMEGEELSFFALVDGEITVELGSAQDHKAVGEGDTGPNTGGMGTYAPAPLATRQLSRQVMEKIVLPVAKAMVAEGSDYRGVLFVGLMITKTGPKVVEFNVRFGDPETQVLMARIQDDVLMLLAEAAQGRLSHTPIAFRPESAMCVVMAAEGYPGEPRRNTEIRNLEAAGAVPGVKVLHAGTRREGGKILADGGRVLGVTALGATLQEAKEQAYKAVDAIDWPEGFCRRDIGWRALASNKAA